MWQLKIGVLRWVAALTLGCTAALAGCSHGPAQARIRTAIQSAATAVRQLDVGAMEDVLSPAFDGNRGQLDRRHLLDLMRVERLRGEHVSVLLGPIDIEPRGDRYVATFDVTLGGGSGILPHHVGVYRVQTAWRLEHGQWRCYSARWQQPH